MHSVTADSTTNIVDWQAVEIPETWERPDCGDCPGRAFNCDLECMVRTAEGIAKDESLCQHGFDCATVEGDKYCEAHSIGSFCMVAGLDRVRSLCAGCASEDDACPLAQEIGQLADLDSIAKAAWLAGSLYLKCDVPLRAVLKTFWLGYVAENGLTLDELQRFDRAITKDPDGYAGRLGYVNDESPNTIEQVKSVPRFVHLYQWGAKAFWRWARKHAAHVVREDRGRERVFFHAEQLVWIVGDFGDHLPPYTLPAIMHRGTLENYLEVVPDGAQFPDPEAVYVYGNCRFYMTGRAVLNAWGKRNGRFGEYVISWPQPENVTSLWVGHGGQMFRVSPWLQGGNTVLRVKPEAVNDVLQALWFVDRMTLTMESTHNRAAMAWPNGWPTAMYRPEAIAPVVSGQAAPPIKLAWVNPMNPSIQRFDYAAPTYCMDDPQGERDSLAASILRRIREAGSDGLTLSELKHMLRRDIERLPEVVGSFVSDGTLKIAKRKGRRGPSTLAYVYAD